jgi:hypothetical protein
MPFFAYRQVWRPAAASGNFADKEPIGVAVADSVWVVCNYAGELWEFPTGAPRPV